MARQIIFAETMLTATGWRDNAHLVIDNAGRIESIGVGAPEGAIRVGALLPAMANLHSHSFQRAMAGLTEKRGGDPQDDFWSWRALMYRFLDRLGPDEIEAIAVQVQMEMLEAGYAAIGEFHYIHHAPGGAAYDDPAELSLRVIAAASQTGIGLTHLPVLYMRGGLDGRALQGGQLRFGCDTDQFGLIFDGVKTALERSPADFRLGIAPHSLRAVDETGLCFAHRLAGDAPIHIHIAEQTGEVEEVEAALGAWPARWLLDHMPVDERWCLVHATHMTSDETRDLAMSGAVAGLCPMTEANLGDGLFNAPMFFEAGGRAGIGSDSNVLISLADELRLLEYSQRLARRRRNMLADDHRSTGRFLYETAARGGAQALARDAGRVEPGAVADLAALDLRATTLAGLSGDTILDAWIFAGDDRLVTDVWSAGRHVVRDGRHVGRDMIETRFNAVMATLHGG